ncbi:MAG: type II secretion system F family protein [Myxococcales bacterium]|nr:type II secretion system F family protein [Myxococcales bacterium]
MNPNAGLLHLGTLLVALGGGGALFAVACSESLKQRLTRYVAALDTDLRFQQRNLSARQLLAMQAVGCGLSAVTALWTGSPVPALLAPALAFPPRVILQQLSARRTRALEAQLDSWLTALAGALRSTPALGDAIASTMALAPAPMRQELSTVMREVQLGVAIDAALMNMGQRSGSATIKAALMVLRIGRNVGGGLGATLETAADNLREMARLEGVVRTKTAEGRGQATVISIIPLPLLGSLHLLDPTFLAPLWQTTLGHMVLAGAIALWFLAALWARKIAAVEI